MGNVPVYTWYGSNWLLGNGAETTIPVKCSGKRPATLIPADGQDLMAAESSEAMEIGIFFKAGKSPDWRSSSQLPFTTALMPRATSVSVSSALQRKATLRQDHTSTGTNIPLDFTTTADIKMWAVKNNLLYKNWTSHRTLTFMLRFLNTCNTIIGIIFDICDWLEPHLH